jgi:hypothetical protein
VGSAGRGRNRGMRTYLAGLCSVSVTSNRLLLGATRNYLESPGSMRRGGTVMQSTPSNGSATSFNSRFVREQCHSSAATPKRHLWKPNPPKQCALPRNVPNGHNRCYAATLPGKLAAMQVTSMY